MIERPITQHMASMKFEDFKIDGPASKPGEFHETVKHGGYAIFNATGAFVELADSEEDARWKIQARVDRYNLAAAAAQALVPRTGAKADADADAKADADADSDATTANGIVKTPMEVGKAIADLREKSKQTSGTAKNWRP
jgi:hypothetical protein